MADHSRFHEHINDTGSDVHKPPSFLFAATRNFVPGNRQNRRWSPLVQERPREPRNVRQTDTLNCNGLAFRHTRFVPRPDQDMVEFTWGAGSRGNHDADSKRRRNRTPATIASFAGFLLVPYALRKARQRSKERKKSKQEAERSRNMREEEPNRHDSAMFVTSPFKCRDCRPSSSSLDTSIPESEKLAAGSTGDEDHWETDTGTGSSVTMLERVNSDGRGSLEGSSSRRSSSAILYGNWSRDLEAVVEEGSSEIDANGTPRAERKTWREV
ncbi:unnamed protein product [Cercospora beticola]|nr:unnamed protein product [Cercospora beticola]